MAERRAAASATLVPSIAVITSPWERPASDAGPPLTTVVTRTPPLVASATPTPRKAVDCVLGLLPPLPLPLRLPPPNGFVPLPFPPKGFGSSPRPKEPPPGPTNRAEVR